MRKLVEYIAQSLVDDPSAVQVREVRNDRNALVLELHVAPDDFGKVIGRQGRVAKAMRTLLRPVVRVKAVILTRNIVESRKGKDLCQNKERQNGLLSVKW